MFFKKMPSITPNEVNRLPKDAQIIDVREPYEFATGHIPGAKNIPLGKVAAFKSTKTVYVICQSGMRSRMATKILRKNKVDAVNITGGMNAWLRNGGR